MDYRKAVNSMWADRWRRATNLAAGATRPNAYVDLDSFDVILTLWPWSRFERAVNKLTAKRSFDRWPSND